MENDVKRKNEKRRTAGVNVKFVNNKSNVKTLDVLNGHLVQDAEINWTKNYGSSCTRPEKYIYVICRLGGPYGEKL